MNYILVYGAMEEIGGIENIILRLSQTLVDAGHYVCVMTNPGELLKHLDSRVFVSSFKDTGSITNALESIHCIDKSVRIIAFDPISTAVGIVAVNFFLDKGVSVQFASGVYHPRAFRMESEKKHVHVLNNILRHAINIKCIFFMNDNCKEAHLQIWGSALSLCPVIPVPIDTRPAIWTSHRSNSRLRIVCVGRIVPFKAYNFSLPRIVADLVGRAYDITCDIYGHGTDVDRLQYLLDQNDISGRVQFKGPLPLEKFDKTVSGYDVFIGMGTAALQAAQLGVPTILAIDQDPEQCYGFLHEAPFGNVGEVDNAIPKRGISDVLEDLMHMTSEQELHLSCAGIEAANLYNISEYADRIFANPATNATRTGILSYKYCLFYLWMARNNALRRAVRKIRDMLPMPS